MVVRRDKNTGEPIEKPTRKLFSAEETKRQGAPEEKPAERRVGHGRAKVPGIKDAYKEGPQLPDSFFSRFEAPTEKLAPERQGKDDNDRTRLIRPKRGPAERGDEDSMADPVVGWLVVVSGPGKGQACQLGYGSNSIGRSGKSRIRLDFGDDRISRDGHATITYDPRGRKFYLQHGGGKNLTYLGESPVLVPTVLEAMQEFSIGNTTLRFIPFCGPEFEWDDTDGG